MQVCVQLTHHSLPRWVLSFHLSCKIQCDSVPRIRKSHMLQPFNKLIWDAFKNAFRVFESANGVVNPMFVYMATPKSEMLVWHSLILYRTIPHAYRPKVHPKVYHLHHSWSVEVVLSQEATSTPLGVRCLDLSQEPWTPRVGLRLRGCEWHRMAIATINTDESAKITRQKIWNYRELPTANIRVC